MQTEDVSQQNQDLSHNVDTIKEIKDKIKCEKELLYKNKLDEILANLNVKQKQLNEMVLEKVISNWLNVYLLKECGLDLNNQ